MSRMLPVIVNMDGYWVVSVRIACSMHPPFIQLSLVRTSAYCPHWPLYSKEVIKASGWLIGTVLSEALPGFMAVFIELKLFFATSRSIYYSKLTL